MAPAYRSGNSNTLGGSGNPTVTFTTVTGDHLVVFCAALGSTTSPSGGTCADNQSGTYTLVGGASYGTKNGLAVFVRDQTVASGTSTVITWTPNNTIASGAIAVHAASGMALFGANSVRQSKALATQSSGTTPAPVFTNAVLTGNMTYGMVGNQTNPASMTEPTSWAEKFDVGISGPVGLETVSRDSGFTGTTVTWGSTSGSAYGAFILELGPGTTFSATAALALTEALTIAASHTTGNRTAALALTEVLTIAAAHTTANRAPALGLTEALTIAASHWTRHVTAGLGLSWVSGATIIKTGGSNGTWDAGASSVQTLTGDGYIEVMPKACFGDVFVGLSITDPDLTFNTIKYAWYINGGVNANVYELGSAKLGGSFSPGDRLRIRRTGTTITYEVVAPDGTTTVRYTSLVTTASALLIDTSLDQLTPTPASIAGLRLFNGATETAPTWQNATTVSTTQQPIAKSFVTQHRTTGLALTELLVAAASHTTANRSPALAMTEALVAAASHKTMHRVQALSLAEALTVIYSVAFQPGPKQSWYYTWYGPRGYVFTDGWWGLTPDGNVNKAVGRLVSLLLAPSTYSSGLGGDTYRSGLVALDTLLSNLGD